MQNKKWILFIIHKAYPCNIGGIEVFNYHLINELSSEYNVHVLTLCKNVKFYKSVKTHLIKKYAFQKLTQPISTLIFLFQNRKKIKFVHVSFSKAYWTHWYIYVIAKKLFKIKYIFTIHGGSMAKWKPKWPYHSFFKYAESITGVSERIVNEYKKRSKKNITFTPPLIPFNVIKEKNKFKKKWFIENDNFIILYVGSIKPLKAVDSLIEAISLLPKNIIIQKKLKVLIAGNGISKNNLEIRVRELNLQDIIIFLGNVEREDVPQLYNLADIYTICSEFEGLPISLLEAFANKLPCVTSNAPGISNLSLKNKNTLMFETRNSQDYSEKLMTLINDNCLRDELSENAIGYYENHFSYQVLINSFKNIFDRI